MSDERRIVHRSVSFYTIFEDRQVGVARTRYADILFFAGFRVFWQCLESIHS